MKANPLLPEMATILEVVEETANIKTFRVRFDDEEVMKNFTFEPGQVGQLSAFGYGESTFVINSSPTRMDYLQFSVMRGARTAWKFLPRGRHEGQGHRLRGRRYRHGSAAYSAGLHA
jgi:NAD(P)H-flavin reductase